LCSVIHTKKFFLDDGLKTTQQSVVCKGYKVLALLSGDIYIFSDEKIAVVYPMSNILRHQNSWQVVNRLYKARTLCVEQLHLPPCMVTGVVGYRWLVVVACGGDSFSY
jgi:hypothetical protein